jgi:hypothetical protein
MVETGWLPSPTNNREGKPNLAASAAAGPELELALAVVLLPDELPELLGALEPVEPLVAPVLLGALEATDVLVPLGLLETPAPCNPLELVVLVVVLVEVLAAPVTALGVDVDEAEVPPQAARVSATMQQAALGSATRSSSKTGTWLNRGLPPF